MSIVAAFPMLTEGGLLATQAWTTFPEFIAPFLPALIGLPGALALEGTLLWSDREVRFNAWFAIACAAFCILLLIWDSWSRGMPLATLADTPDADGLRFRLILIGFGLLSLGLPGLATYAGIRRIIQEWPLCGTLCSLARLLPAPLIPVLLVLQFRQAFAIFEGMTFRLFY